MNVVSCSFQFCTIICVSYTLLCKHDLYNIATEHESTHKITNNIQLCRIRIYQKSQLIPTCKIFVKFQEKKFESEPGLELGPPDLQPGTLPFIYPGSTASSPPNLGFPLEGFFMQSNLVINTFKCHVFAPMRWDDFSQK